ncbi:putative disease resistance protein RGA1 isoform X2 [Papaver somniferum]|uniref:putative disease resistance protein RGA1 isoform X2 n=1 Tax=Papaver somniferum TaxID=3469 RepID=UPI000E6FE80C|nr:putative disease resistance protein RGA1 isoform X2 [Papaver somniferum]
MEERILDYGASEVLKKLVFAISREMSMAWGVKDELKKLNQTLELIANKTSDAERKQVNDHAVSLWLRRLKDVSYDADDVLDEFSYEATRRSEKNRKVKKNFYSSNPLAFRFKLARQIKGINKRLEDIATDMGRFKLQTSSGPYEQHNKRLTASFIGDDLKIVGRDEDKSNIIRMLTMTDSISSSKSSQSSSIEKVSAISIVGIGGLGKTTLVKSIYKDRSVENHFMKRFWVSTSDNFDVFKILRNIMESITDSNSEDFSSVAVLAHQVRESLKGTKYLLVLSDLWSEDLMGWNNLKSVLDFGSVGSKIIVTTRSQRVASMVQGLFPPYNLGALSAAECWSIMKNKAFFPGGASETPTMENIGKDIAKKCGGSPLAAKFFGCLMHSQNDEKHWLSIRDDKSLETNGYEGIIRILKLSYDNLSSHLKQCFVYCCLFPKDWVFNRETLIRLWIAEGFIHPFNEGNGNSLEDIGNDYFLSLLSSCFFQDVEKNDLGDITWFTMHDLVHDLALSLASGEVAICKASGMENDASGIRRLLLMGEGLLPITISDVLENAKKLRTFFFQGGIYPNASINKRLRVIHRLGAKRQPETISSSNFKFKHIRYFDLSYCNFEDVHAESIHQLYNLQTLDLHHSKNVQNIFKEGIGSLISLRCLDLSSSDANLLPDSIGHLQNLSSLDISSTKISELPDSICLLYNLTRFNFSHCRQLKALPRNFGALTQLRSLDLIGTEITELPESLTSNICKLEFVTFGESCKFPEDIKNWVELRHLKSWGRRVHHVIAPKGIEKLIRLEILAPYLVRKEAFSTRISNDSSSSIQELADLNSLRKLVILSLENVRGGKIEAEKAKLKDKQNIQDLYLGWKSEEEEEVEDDEDEYKAAINSVMVLEGLQPHPNLEILSIKGFLGLKLPKWLGSSSCLPNLVELRFENCNSCIILVGLGQLPCLEILRIMGMDSLECLGEEFYYREEEESTTYSAKPTTRTLFPSLIKLIIENMKNLIEWVAPPSRYISFPCLEEVDIYRCGNLITVPDFRLCTSLRELSIQGCDKLNKESTSYGFIQKEEQPDDPSDVYQSLTTERYRAQKISSGTPEIREIEKVSHTSNLENVRGGMEDVERLKLKEMQHLEDLNHSWNYPYDDADVGIDGSANDGKVLEGLHPSPNQKILTISGFEGLKLPKWMGLSHLVELYFSDCKRCEKLPALGMLPCLVVLRIYGMMSLKCLGQEFYFPEESTSSSAKATLATILFPSLIRFELGDIDNLEEWVAPLPHYCMAFPVLETLGIIGCSKLTSIPDFRLTTSLWELTIEDCDKLYTKSISYVEQNDDPNPITTESAVRWNYYRAGTTDRYLVKEITSGTAEDSGIQDITALETEKFLHIRNLENVRGGREVAERAKLRDKQHLEDLYLSWDSFEDGCIDRSVNDGEVLEGLQPHPNLQKLTISGSRGLKLPNWMGFSNYLPHLVEIYFYGCNSCKQLPALGMLPCLRILKIEEMNLLQSLGQEFYYQQQESSCAGSSSSNYGEIKEEKINTKKQTRQAFSSFFKKNKKPETSLPSSSGISVFHSLVELNLIDMSILEEWAAPHDSFKPFSSLESLIVSGCLRLKSIPFSSCSSLKNLELCHTNDEAVNLILASTGGERLTTLASVSIKYSPQLQFFPVLLLQNNDTRIQSLEIAHCPNFKGFRILNNKELRANVSSDTGFNCSCLPSFKLFDYVKLASSDTGFDNNISSLCSLKLFDCPALSSVPDLREWNSLNQLWIEDCDKLKESFSYSLKSLTHLRPLYVDGFINPPQN